MSRGESGSGSGRSRGLAIGISFALLCLGALALVLRTTRAIESFHAPWAYHPPAEPVIGVFAALRSVSGVCAGQDAGPVLPGAARANPSADLATWLVEQGMIELPEAAETLGPMGKARASRLDGSCGLALVVAEPGASVLTTGGLYRAFTVMSTCGEDGPTLESAGSLHARYFAFPGLSADDRAATGLSGSSLLRMAIAEATLARRGFVPGREYVVETVASGPAGARHFLSPPATPSSGCVAWLALGEGLSGASSSFEGQPIGSSCSYDLEDAGFAVALLSCASVGASAGTGQVGFVDTDGDGGRVYFRPFGIASTGPRLAAPAPATVAGSLREAASGSIPLPTPIPRREP